jgi:hypothetical protein
VRHSLGYRIVQWHGDLAHLGAMSRDNRILAVPEQGIRTMDMPLVLFSMQSCAGGQRTPALPVGVIEEVFLGGSGSVLKASGWINLDMLKTAHPGFYRSLLDHEHLGVGVDVDACDIERDGQTLTMTSWRLRGATLSEQPAWDAVGIWREWPEPPWRRAWQSITSVFR